MTVTERHHALEPVGPQHESAKLRCVLVHGTRARDAKWVQAESEFAQALLTLDPGGVCFYKFLWSGANAQVDRASAADSLTELLGVEAGAHPDAKFLLIGHSHGGNICSNAIKGVPPANRVGVVCLATPFLSARARSLRTLMWIRFGYTILAVGACVAIFLMLGAFLLKFAPWLFKLKIWVLSLIFGEPIPPVLAVIPGVTAVLGSLAWAWKFGFGQHPRPEPGQLRAMELWNRFAPTEVPTLCIWHGLDEAFWGLRAARQVGEAGHHFVGWVERYILPVLIVFCTIAGIWISFSEHGGVYVYGDNSAAIRTGLAVLVGGLSMIVVPVALWWATAAVSSVTRIALGRISIMDHLWLDVSIGRIPSIRQDLVEARELPLFKSSVLANLLLTFPVLLGPLIHSRPYMDMRTASVIRGWYWGQKGCDVAAARGTSEASVAQP